MGYVHINGLAGVDYPRIVSSVDLAPSTLASGDNTLVAAPGAGIRAALANIGVQNTDTVTRTIIFKHGSTVFRQYDLAAGTTLEIWLPFDSLWIAASNTAIVANASAGSVLKVAGGRYHTVRG